mmetsp:Transcript_19081/g.67387  ORF Transcript_19081/g.67387 Transcript_19081/m.67387 type:complete len:177 (-) Transcript_19081:30-560(-)
MVPKAWWEISGPLATCGLSLRHNVYLVSLLHVLFYTAFPIYLIVNADGKITGEVVVLLCACVLYNSSALNAFRKAREAEDSEAEDAVGGNRRAARWALLWAFSVGCNGVLNFVVTVIGVVRLVKGTTGATFPVANLGVMLVCAWTCALIVSFSRERGRYRDQTFTSQRFDDAGGGV